MPWFEVRPIQRRAPLEFFRVAVVAPESEVFAFGEPRDRGTRRLPIALPFGVFSEIERRGSFPVSARGVSHIQRF